MSSIRSALEQLDNALGKLDSSVSDVEHNIRDVVPAAEMYRQVQAAQQEERGISFRDSTGNVVDVDFVARRLDKAIETVEYLLKEDA